MKIVKKQLNSHDCLICGLDNEFGVHAHFYETDEHKVISKFHYHFNHQSYPERTHGGMIAALLDELVGRAVLIKGPNLWGVTMKLEVKYRKPVPYKEDLLGIGEIVSETSRTFLGRGEIQDMNGNVLAEAEATYMKLPIEKITDTSNPHAEMFMAKDENPPKF